MSVAAVVLAAGGSTRFGKPKQFALFQGETFIKRIVAAAIEAGCAPVVVVTGEDSAQVTSELTRVYGYDCDEPRLVKRVGILNRCRYPTCDESRSRS